MTTTERLAYDRELRRRIRFNDRRGRRLTDAALDQLLGLVRTGHLPPRRMEGG